MLKSIGHGEAYSCGGTSSEVPNTFRIVLGSTSALVSGGTTINLSGVGRGVSTLEYTPRSNPHVRPNIVYMRVEAVHDALLSLATVQSNCGDFFEVSRVAFET